ncbi:M1 family metallopeptidase [Candidatus Nitrosacidococcus tergens]|uniref:Peptidase M28 n=1 Tax=Candidatus Nitrosacidococcus tergens TaxID=553981 RepID=A0A7G1Q849_9GAMM
MKIYQKIISGLLFLAISPLLQAEEIHHQLEVYLDPDNHHLKAIDTITLPDSYSSPIAFRLHNHLNPQLENSEIEFKKLKENEFTEDYTLTLPKDVHKFTLSYEGEIFHPIKPVSQEYTNSFSSSSGIIALEGVFLTGSSYWYPQFANDGLITFSLTTHLPLKWHSVSQGIRTQQDTQEIWKENHPQEEIYLIAGQFTEYDGKAENGKVTTMAFLQRPDLSLAHKYLEATSQYLEMYRSLISPYPYGKFALVENFWETGYGMPSFTLLGSNVIRFPFILHSSYPHEILHNWWGNGVYVKYSSGNWTEGLTAYLADHLLKEQQGEGSIYRRETLQKYTDYVQEVQDFPLMQFRGRDSAASQAVGYGKTLMVFHMLRQKLGDKLFIKALQDFYHQYQYAPAGFSELEESFEKTSGQLLHSFFNQWITRPGAPLLKIKSAQVTPKGGKYVLTATIVQAQGGKPYQLTIPIAIYLENSDKVYQTQIDLDKREHKLELIFSNRPLKFEIDPQFDVFRRLDPNEIPPALSQAFGAKKALAVLPASAFSALKESYQQLIETWQQEGRDIKIVMDNTIDKLPNNQMVWLLGWENQFRSVFDQALEGYHYQANTDSVKIKNHILDKAHHSVVVATRPKNNPHQALAWIATNNVAALPGLTRKLPHYGKYSYLGFIGSEPENTAKGQWSVIRSPMSVLFAQDLSVIKSTLLPQQPLISLSSQFSQD